MRVMGWKPVGGTATAEKPRPARDSLMEKDTPAPWLYCDRQGAADPRCPLRSGLETVS